MTLSDRMARAEDYVFGLMDEQERHRAERDMEIDPEFRECVMVLAEQLRRLRQEKRGSVSFPNRAWNEISQRIAALPQMAGAGSAERLAGLALSNAGDPSRKGMLKLRRPLAHHFAGFKATIVSLGLIAALGMGYVVGEQSSRLPSPVALSLLADDADNPAVFIETWQDRSVRLVPLNRTEVPEGKVLQFWIDGKPVAVLPSSLEALLRGPELPLPRDGVTYSITLEDAPGVSQGQAPGPALFKGVASAIER